MKLEHIFQINEGKISIKPIAYEYESVAKFIKHHETANTGHLMKEFAFVYYYLTKDVFPTKKDQERIDLIQRRVSLPIDWKISKQLKKFIDGLTDDFETPIEISLKTVYSALTICTQITNETLDNMKQVLIKLNKLSKDDDNEQTKKERLDYTKSLQSEVHGIMKIATELPKLIKTTKELEDEAKKEIVKDVNLGNKKITIFED